MFRKVTSHRYASGQPDIDQIKKLKKAGIDVVINLRPTIEFDDNIARNNLTEQSIAYYNIAVDGPDGLTMENVKALDKVLNEVKPADNVLLYCSTSNRVGALMALRANWLQGKAPEQAIEIGRDYGLKSLETVVKFKFKPDIAK